MLFETGEQWWLTPEEQAELKTVNNEFGAVLPVRELMLETFDFRPAMCQLELVGGGRVVDASKRIRMTATSIVQLFGIPTSDQKALGAASRALRELAGKPERSNGQTVWRLLPSEEGRYFSVLRDLRNGQNEYGRRKAKCEAKGPDWGPSCFSAPLSQYSAPNG